MNIELSWSSNFELSLSIQHTDGNTKEISNYN
jgi:hypothetical protein